MKTNKKPFSYLQYRLVFVDVARFCFYLFITYILTFLLIWGYIHMSLEAYVLSMDEMMFDLPSGENDMPEFTLGHYDVFARRVGHYIFLPACFCVFFAVPPKPLQHVVAVVSAVFLMGSMTYIFVPASVLEIIYRFFFLIGFALIPWILSLAWYEFKGKKENRPP